MILGDDYQCLIIYSMLILRISPKRLAKINKTLRTKFYSLMSTLTARFLVKYQ